MRIVEENKLKDIIEIINKNLDKYPNIEVLYNHLNHIRLLSLQSLSLQEDYVFFDEVSFILSVISSIITHPHLSTRGEDVIVRTELAGNISADAFNQVVKEPILWKEKGLEMVPEHVHYYQYNDELKIYENIFITKLIDMLGIELSKYQAFYISLIPTLDDNSNVLKTKELSLALDKIERLNRRLSYIKNTSFYKEVSKAKLTFKNVHATNILLKDRLYNHCFKFYRKFIQYEDQESLLRDFRLYYYMLILKVFRNNEFEYIPKKTNKLNHLRFKYNGYQITLEYGELEQNIKLTIKHRNIVTTHQLLLNLDRVNADFAINTSDFTSTHIASIWHLNNSRDLSVEASVAKPEYELLLTWVMSQMKEINGSQSIFTKYCPICTSRNISMETDNIYVCDSCNSKYTFKTKNTVWFIDVRR